MGIIGNGEGQGGTLKFFSCDNMKQKCSAVYDLKSYQKNQKYILYSQVWFRRESSVAEEFALHVDICNLGSGFLVTDYY